MKVFEIQGDEKKLSSLRERERQLFGRVRQRYVGRDAVL
jgi:hypothetical protein